ncbi:MAG: class I SAM-dependent methyltransferase [Acidobacteria bacterium]|nr:MAG: class I SAM-dependent methyltransferase [Acidobacteriota bacterium]
MQNMPRSRVRPIALLLLTLVVGADASAQEKAYEPTPGQAGKDVVWVPTPQELVEKMLDMAKVTPQDIVIDLGSGDGRNVIAAAKRGARAIGFEFNPDMVALSRLRAKEAGVADRATFVEGDMFEADISKATVLALFLLPTNLDKLAPKFLTLNPGTRIVNNTFNVTGWDADASETIEGTCTSWCTSMLNIVPARVAGTWRTGSGDLTLTQDFQKVSGTLGTTAVSGRLHGEQITFKAGDTEYKGKVTGDRMEGTSTNAGKTQSWSATK